MIVIYHDANNVIDLFSEETLNFSFDKKIGCAAVLIQLAENFPNSILVWCHVSAKENLNTSCIPELFSHQKNIFSFNPNPENYFGKRLGYIEDTPYIKVNKSIKYGTWQMSSYVGAIHSSVILALKSDLNSNDSLDYFLNSLARRAMPKGLFCYSEPKLVLNSNGIYSEKKLNLAELYRFSKQHYKFRWIVVLFLNLFLFEKKFTLVPFVKSLFYKKRAINTSLLDEISISINPINSKNKTIDVLIPTIGRKKYLEDVLNNLVNQTIQPNNVIIIEQNPDENASSDLDFLKKKWPFKIIHHFTHQTGVCNARNIGLSLIESDYVFMADDDIVFDTKLIENALNLFQTSNLEAFLVCCHLKNQNFPVEFPKQFAVFGAGHAFVKSSFLENLKFNLAYEFGFGEDNDFGMQLRNAGCDIHYISTFKILHLKAPIGGFRTKPVLKWSNDAIQPKPSPTVMLFRIKHTTKEQLLSYKINLFAKNIQSSFYKNPFKYLKTFKQKWNRSIYWANELNKN